MILYDGNTSLDAGSVKRRRRGEVQVILGDLSRRRDGVSGTGSFESG